MIYTITFALYFPLVIIILFGAVQAFLIYRDYAGLVNVREAVLRALQGEGLLSGVSRTDKPTSYLKVTQTDENAVLRETARHFDKCKGVTGASVPSECFQGANSLWEKLKNAETPVGLSKPPSLGTFWHSYPNVTESVDRLPWSLYEPYSPTEPAFNKVHYLPTVCIRRGCLESFNETGATISTINSEHPQNCSRVQPLCWQNDVRTDFDGDGIEDIALFRPKGTVTVSGSTAADAISMGDEADWIVYKSGYGFSTTSSGHGYFNLGIERPPSQPDDIPIAADYDRDGLTDYAIYQPAEGRLMIAYSSKNFRTIWQWGNSQLQDSDNSQGFFAIPGIYGTPDVMQVAIVRSGGSSGSGRYDVFFVTPPSALQVKGAPDGIWLQAVSGSGLEHVTDFRIKPHKGTAAVPAFADYNRDGISELGYLSWYTGNPTKKIAGDYLNPANKNFEDTSVGEVNPQTSKVNPFAMAVGPRGDLYYTDAVQGTIWKITPVSGETVDGENGETLTAVVNLNPDNQGNSVSNFPEYNVMNVPALPAQALEKEYPAAKYPLNSPRKIAVGPDGVMYVADWGNGALTRIDPAGARSIDENSLAKPLIYAGRNVFPCAAANLYTSVIAAGSSGLPVSDFADVCFNPIAVAIVPEPGSETQYHVAFSDGNAVYLLKSNGKDGPDGSKGEHILLIAGVADTSVSNSYSWRLVLQGATPVVGVGTPICQISDLKFDLASYSKGNKDLIAASSCNTARRPFEISPLPFVLNTTTFPMAGAILRLNLNNALGGSGSPTARIVAGGYYGEAAVCGNMVPRSLIQYTPSSATIQRKVNITPRGSVSGANAWGAVDPLFGNDIFNPVSIEIDPLGNILFVNQWNRKARDLSGAIVWQCSSNPGFKFDNHFSHGVYRINTGTKDIEAVTNPYSYGGYSVPVESGMWYSPNTDKTKPVNSWDRQWVTPWDNAPVKNVPFPAVSSLVFSNNRQILYTAAPYQKADNWYFPPTPPAGDPPSSVDQRKVGFVHRIKLDTDGDGVSDFDRRARGSWVDTGGVNDDDLDGDSLGNSSEELSTYRSQFCPEIGDNGDYPCRVTERIGSPKWIFFSKSPQTINVSIPYFANASANLFTGAEPQMVEYFLVSSLSEYGAPTGLDGGNTSGVRQEPWAILLDSKANNILGDSDRNGPIARPAPLHTFVGKGVCAACTSASSIGSYIDKSGNTVPDKQYQFYFPFVQGSLAPLESGIKPVKREFDATSGTRFTNRSGSLCYDSKKFSFKLPYLSNVAKYFLDSALVSVSAGTAYNDTYDSLSYLFACDYLYQTTLPSYPSTNGLRIATEPIVLALDHDDLDFRDTNPFSTTTNWPPPSISGRDDPSGGDSKIENPRILNLVDLDGDGLRNPTYYGREVFIRNQSVRVDYDNVIKGDSSDPQTLPFVVASAGLRTGSLQIPYLKSFEESRYPFSSKNAVDGSSFPLSFNPATTQNLTSYPNVYRFQSDITGSNDYSATLFDPGYSSFPAGETARSDGLIVTLDREPKIPSFTSEIIAIPGVEANLPAEVSSVNRFIDATATLDGCDGNYSPGIIPKAAMRRLRKVLNIERCYYRELIGDELSQSGNGYVSLLPAGCGGGSSTECSSIEFGYTKSLFGNVYLLRESVKIQ